MPQLTQEHFDEALKQLVSKKDLDERLAPLATKAELDEMEHRISTKLDAMLELLDVRNKVTKLQEDVRELQLKIRAR